jgi:hypothetical protein
MTDQVSALETNDTSLSLDDILNPKKTEDKKEPEVVDKTKAEDKQPEATAEDKPSEQPKTDEALDKLKKRLEDTQKWGNSQRQATLQIIKNLKEKGLSDEDIADTIGGKEVFDKVLKGLPIEQELSNPVAVVNQAFNSQIGAVEAAFKELGHTDEQLKEFMEAFNTLAYDEPEHRDEMYRRATSGEGNVAAYALKVGKEKLEEYRLSKEIKSKGVKSFEQELREKIKQELLSEMKSVKDEVEEELGKSKGKPRLVGGSTPTTESKPNDHKSLKDILGM